MNTKNPKPSAGARGTRVWTLLQRSCLGTLALAALFGLSSSGPNCNPTSGITRTPTTRTFLTMNDAVKSTASGGYDAWPRDKYLNLWVCNLTGVIGYGQFSGRSGGH